MKKLGMNMWERAIRNNRYDVQKVKMEVHIDTKWNDVNIFKEEDVTQKILRG